MTKTVQVLIMIALVLTGMLTSPAFAAFSCESIFSQFSNLPPAAADRIERARVALNRSLSDSEIATVLKVSSEVLYKKDVITVLREAGFKAGEAKVLVDYHIALPDQPIVFNSKQLKKVEDLLLDSQNRLRLTPEEKTMFLGIIKSESPEMGSQLASAAGFSVLVHKTSHILFESILSQGAIIPGAKVKDQELRTRAYYYSIDMGSTGFGTMAYDRAFFQPLVHNSWKNAKANGGYFFVFDLKLFNDSTADFNNFYAHSQVGFKLREDPAGFLLSLLMARGTNQSEIKTKVGLSLKDVKYIVVPTNNYESHLKKLHEKGIRPPEGRTWEEILVSSDMVLGGR